MAGKEYLCSACEWTGKGEALVECPICGKDLTELTLVVAESHSPAKKPEKYDPKKLEKISEEEDVDAAV